MGQDEPVREFIEWFGPHQYANGKIPCCVDQRGADPVPENDSSGEFIFLVAEYLRYTGDRELAAREWPRVLDAAAFLDSLRQTHRTDEYRQPDKAHFFGLLPPSISHEGYSAKPMHSYWDDLFALRGFKDAVYLAGELGHDDDRARLTRVRDEFQRELVASFAAAMTKHAIDYLPGCADLGDFDATSTTIALSPVQAEDVLPRVALERTFEKYYEFFTARAGGAEWDAYTPYEIRNIGAFVRLGWRDRAAELIDFFVHDQRPPGWRQWSEVVFYDQTTPRFVGDIPHTWVGSDFVRSMLDAIAYPRERDESLVLAAGIPRAWIDAAPGVRVTKLPTPYGPLTYTMRTRAGGIELQIEEGPRVPPGGIVIRPPVLPGTEARIDGGTLEAAGEGEWIIRSLPATITFEASR